VDAVYAGTTDFTTSTGSLSGGQQVDQISTTTALVSSLNPSTSGDNVTFTATVSPATASGTVEFFDGASSLGTGALSGGVATLSTGALSVATHSITAAYGGDATHATSTSPALSQVVNPASLSTVSAVSPGGTISPATPTATVPVTLSRLVTTPMLGFSVDFTVSSNASVPSGGIAEGAFLGASGTPTSFQIQNLGGGRYIADGVTLGNTPQCGSSALSGTLFTVALNSSAGSGTATVTINSVTLRDCDNATLPSQIGTAASVDIDNTGPVVAVVTPNGGESWAAGSSQSVTWTATDASGVTGADLAYSTDNGSNWTSIATGEANDGTYTWTVPVTPSTTALVRVTAYDGVGNSANDASDAVFSITDATAPVVAVVTPNGGESWAAGSSQAITWTATDNVGVTSIDLAYSTDNGTNWTTIATGEANDGTYTWTVPNTPSTTALVRVTAYDAAANSTADVSDAVFSITDATAPVVAVVTPNGGESWAAGSSQAITWTATDNVGVTSIALAYSVDNGSNWTTIATGEANDGTYTWTVPNTPSTTALVRVTAHDAAANSTADVSDAVFSITDATAPVVAVVTPNGGESWVAGSSQSITWTATDNIGVTSIDLAYSVDNGTNWTTIATGEANDGTYTWTVPATPSTTALVRVTAYDAAANSTADASDAVFSITDATAPVVAVVTPNGGETWTPGTVQNITWTATDNVGVTSIDLAYSVDSGSNWTTIATGEVNDGTYTWTVPNTPSLQALARVTAHDAAANSTADVSDAVFTIPSLSVAAISNLAATQKKTGNGGANTTRITLTWSGVAPTDSVIVYRKGFGNYPEYDDAGGAAPSTPGAYPPAGWARAVGATGVSSVEDDPGARDYWYYVAYVKDVYGTVSPVSNRTSGTLSYHLGDVTNGTPGTGDDLVNTIDISLLGAHYGISLVPGDTYNYLDVGPTVDYSVNTRPVTDNVVNFEDLVMFAINYGAVSAPQASLTVAAATADEVVLEAPQRVAAGGEVTVRLLYRGTGRVRALSTALAWDAAVVEPVRYAGSEGVLGDGGVVLSAKPGTVDAALLGARTRGFTGEGELATITFRVIAAGEPRFGVKSVDARDAANAKVEMGATTRLPAPVVPLVTSLAPAAPNPFADRTTIAFGLSQTGRVELALFSVDGRRARTLARGTFQAGEYRMTWDGRDEDGRLVSPGVYYAQLVTAQGRFTKKVTLLQ
jgi:hypothetical protein